ncbi:Na+/H+ antiporter subunit E [Allosphingosinicella indica]|uniref:Multicomponent Na+:H+ antiporter subunit E n=1 Tax=Allosphingosinicella indica TaxID=941907 RepID=A0A1X7GCM3_9SPHN|nr:Na+/H+ antiporter subunit E [Allosphingosinicella indica]SMF67786.1 multicomponent Na+:H+ antiporter subunit E [Allosphingosinicella indica]
MRLFAKARALLMLLLSFVWDLFASTGTVARIVLSPRIGVRPAILVMPTKLQKPWAVAMLAYFTSLTPGSTCLHVSEDRQTLHLHILDLHDADATIAKFRRLYERRIAELEA